MQITSALKNWRALLHLLLCVFRGIVNLIASPFNINLVGTALSTNSDTDGDGLNDALEFQLAAAGFDWNVSQPALVSSFLGSNRSESGQYGFKVVGRN